MVEHNSLFPKYLGSIDTFQVTNSPNYLFIELFYLQVRFLSQKTDVCYYLFSYFVMHQKNSIAKCGLLDGSDI